MGNKILSQGALDGTCYLYSIMNAYKTLTYPEMDIMDFINLKPYETSGACKWEYIIRTCPQTLDMFVGGSIPQYILGTNALKIDKIINDQYKNSITTSFNILSDSNFQFSVRKTSLEEVKNNTFDNSVIILPIIKKIKTLRGNELLNHFICINGREADNLQIMCSYTIHKLNTSEYYEAFNPKNKRYYNNMINLELINEITLDKGVDVIYEICKV